MTDPHYKENLIKFFKDKGFKYKDIDAWMQRNNIDGKINEAKAKKYNDAYYQAVMNNDPLGASYLLSQLAGVDKNATAINTTTIPSYKDLFNIQVNRDNAKQMNEWKKEAAKTLFNRQMFANDKKFKQQLALQANKEKLSLEAYKAKLGIEWQQIASVYGEDVANTLMANKLAGIRNGSSDKSSSRNGNGEMKTKEREWSNKLEEARMYAYQSLGDINNIGPTFTDENDHNFETYRKMLMDFKSSGYADDDDKAWANEELERLKQAYNTIHEVYKLS